MEMLPTAPQSSSLSLSGSFREKSSIHASPCLHIQHGIPEGSAKAPPCQAEANGGEETSPLAIHPCYGNLRHPVPKACGTVLEILWVLRQLSTCMSSMLSWN